MFRVFIVITFLFASLEQLNAQSKVSYDFKKGQVLDIMLITNKPDIEALFANYKKTAFPVAMKLGYQPQPGFGIAEYTQGNQQPASFIFGKWNSLEKREQFLTDITKSVPDFHEQRRSMFELFALTYYEMQEDISFEIDREKLVVVTAYWQQEASTFQSFTKAWLKTAKRSGGEIILELTDGKSPFAYYYQPDYLVITQWNDREEFNKFYSKNLKMEQEGLRHVNQFILK
ncbi:MAG: hypothetical protein AAGG68_19310 [Bacteroidota bacterium]